MKTHPMNSLAIAKSQSVEERVTRMGRAGLRGPISHIPYPISHEVMSLGAFIVLTLYKTFVYIVGFFVGIALAIWFKFRL